MSVDTYRVNRLQKVGDSWRDHGELIPEAHTFFAVDHLVHTGEIHEVDGVDEAEFRAAVQQYCPELADQIYARVNLDPDSVPEGAHNSPRSEPILPQRLPEKVSAATVKRGRPPRRGAAGKGSIKTREQVTLRVTDIPPAVPTQPAPAVLEES